MSRRHDQIVTDLRRLIEAVEAVDMDDPPTGRAAVRVLNRLELARSDVAHDLAFFVDWLELNANRTPTATDEGRTA